MEKVENINPERLKWCCHEQGITFDELAREAGVPLPNLEKVVAGEPGLTIAHLRKVAEFFGRGILFFLETGPVSSELIHSPQFRTLNNQKANLSPKLRRLVEAVERQRDVYLNLLDELEEADTVRYEPPQIPRDDIERSAAIVRTWLNLDRQSDFSGYRKAVEDKGILVFRSNGYAGKWQIPKDDPICGFSLQHPVCPVIFVKKQAAEVRQTFTLMHELGHLLLHRESFIDEVDDFYAYTGTERDANAFAGALLVPTNVLNEIEVGEIPSSVPRFDDWLKPFRERLGVSTEVLLRRLHDRGRLDQETYESYRRWKQAQPQSTSDGGNRSYRYREPIHVFGDGFVRTVLDALHARHITVTRASGYLDGLKLEHVHRLEGTYANS
ncbi:MAG: XRE family transcriptional regulator [Planctomycetaceae bacterium]